MLLIAEDELNEQQSDITECIDELRARFSPGEFEILHRSATGRRLHDVARHEGTYPQRLFDAVETCRNEKDLVKLLRRALLTKKAGALPGIGRALRLTPLVEIAAYAVAHFDETARIAALETIPWSKRQGFRTAPESTEDGKWLHALLSVDDLSDEDLLSFLERMHTAVLASYPDHAAALRTKVDAITRRTSAVAPPVRPQTGQPKPRTVLVDVGPVKGTERSVSVWVYGLGDSPVHHASTTIGVTPGTVFDNLETLVNTCLNDPEIRDAETVRFDFVLPTDCLSLAVDRLRFGEDEDEAATDILGWYYPVVVRPRRWFLKLPRVFAHKRDAFHQRAGAVKVVRDPQLAHDEQFVEDAKLDSRELAFVLPFDASADGSGQCPLHALLDTTVLALLWVRSDGPHPIESEAQLRYLESLLTKLDEAPEKILAARRETSEPGRNLRAHLGFAWHFDHVEKPPDKTKRKFTTPRR